MVRFAVTRKERAMKSNTDIDVPSTFSSADQPESMWQVNPISLTFLEAIALVAGLDDFASVREPI
jgi:hypothetical protein